MIKWILSKMFKSLEEPLTEEELFLSKIDRKGLINKYQLLQLLNINSQRLHELISKKKLPRGFKIPGM